MCFSPLTASTLVKLSIERMVQNGADEVRTISRSGLCIRLLFPLPNPSIGSLRFLSALRYTTDNPFLIIDHS